MPEQPPKSSDAKTLTWDEIIARFAIHGIPPKVVAQMTLKQVHYALREWNEEVKFQVKLAGGEVKEEDRVATLQDLMAFGM